jgi:hypothetical protein
MASEKQIAANRANAKKSTGPKTATGKLKSSRNAYRHGLSGPLPLDPATSDKAEWMAGEMAADHAGEHQKAAAQNFARAQMELLRIRSIRSEHLAKIDSRRQREQRQHQRIKAAGQLGPI